MNRTLERVFLLLSRAAALGTAAAVLVLVGFLLYRGGGALNVRLFFGEVPAVSALTGRMPVWEGIWPACTGTIVLVFLSSIMALPLGVGAGIYLGYYASGRLKSFIGLAVELLAGVPSIVMGLFGFALILLLRRTLLPHANTCLLLSAVCIALLVLPYLILTTQTSLENLPEAITLVGPSLGLTAWQNVVHVLLPAASRSIFSGVILSVGRVAEDTAVILLTGVVANAGMPASLTGKFEALPFAIYYLAAEHRTVEELNRGFGAAVVLLVLTGVLFMGASWLQKTITRRWNQGRA